MKYTLSWYTNTQSPAEPAKCKELKAKTPKEAAEKAMQFWRESANQEIFELREIISHQDDVWAYLGNNKGIIIAYLTSKNGSSFTWEWEWKN